jgi:hypothetical protein
MIPNMFRKYPSLNPGPDAAIYEISCCFPKFSSSKLKVSSKGTNTITLPSYSASLSIIEHGTQPLPKHLHVNLSHITKRMPAIQAPTA